MNIKRFKFILLSLTALFLFLATHQVSAATLYIAPPSSNVKLGSTFTVFVKTDTKGERVNVAEAKVNFDSDKLKVVSVKPGSTFTLQTPGSPTKTNTEVSFSAGLPTPGYKGSSGILGIIIFKAIALGDADINIVSGKVLLNDGKATDTLSGTSGSTVTILQPDMQSTETTPTLLPQERPDQLDSNPVETNTQQPILQPEAQSILQPSDHVYTITITLTVESLIHILYVAIGIIVLLLTGVIYLLFVNARLRRNLKKE